MKIQKGVLSGPPDAEPAPVPAPSPPADERLFETLQKEETSERSYTKPLLIAATIVIAVGGLIFYLNLPGAGDVVRAPAGMEAAVRDHLLTTQKRTATDITFYYCGHGYWARAGVETRNDIPNPVLRIGSYAVRAVPADGSWTVTSKPITNETDDVPCSL